jgi:hypothetical protein
LRELKLLSELKEILPLLALRELGLHGLVQVTMLLE